MWPWSSLKTLRCGGNLDILLCHLNYLKDAVKAEGKRVEQTLQKAHQMAAWAVKASTTASFFTRTTLLWLRQMQEKIPAGDIHTHQDINKLLAAAEFSVNATLNAARFVPGPSVAVRHLLWLRHWQADNICPPSRGTNCLGSLWTSSWWSEGIRERSYHTSPGQPIPAPRLIFVTPLSG